VILDVDNGPGFLVYDSNAAVYHTPFLQTCHQALREGGAVVVWSADEAADLDQALRRTFASVEHHTTEVVLGTRDERYHTYTAVKSLAARRPACPAP
jgi:spermidine synthase